MKNKVNPIVTKIEESLREKGISNFEAAKITGLNRTTIGRIFAGHNSPSLENLQELAKIADCKLILVDLDKLNT